MPRHVLFPLYDPQQIARLEPLIPAAREELATRHSNNSYRLHCALRIHGQLLTISIRDHFDSNVYHLATTSCTLRCHFPNQSCPD
jgi:hypothetical protein